MTTAALNPSQREQDLAAMRDEIYDVLVIGGGVTGAGSAFDATTRGLRTAIVEAQDWASGTSSRSSRLIHGGLRYLYNLDFALVAEDFTTENGMLTASLKLKRRAVFERYKDVLEGLYSGKGKSAPGSVSASA